MGPDQHHGFQKRLVPNNYPADFSWTKSRDNKIPKSHASGYLGNAVHVGRSGKNLELDECAHSEALKYLTRKGTQKLQNTSYQPFFLCVLYNLPHEPFWPPKKYWDLYEDEFIDVPKLPSDFENRYSAMDRWLNRHHGVDKVDLQEPSSLRRLRRAYYAQVTYIDDKVGELIGQLDVGNLADDTIIVFTSDHGDMLCEKNMVQKRCFYEPSVRVPLVVVSPHTALKGHVSRTPVSLLDIMPTILDLTGVGEPEYPAGDGMSLSPILSGTEQPGRAVFSEMHSEGVYATCFMVRKGKYKYVYIHGHDEQLFDLEKDPDRIEEQLRDSLQRCLLLMKAMQKTGQDWAYDPEKP